MGIGGFFLARTLVWVVYSLYVLASAVKDIMSRKSTAVRANIINCGHLVTRKGCEKDPCQITSSLIGLQSYQTLN